MDRIWWGILITGIYLGIASVLFGIGAFYTDEEEDNLALYAAVWPLMLLFFGPFSFHQWLFVTLRKKREDKKKQKYTLPITDISKAEAIIERYDKEREEW